MKFRWTDENGNLCYVIGFLIDPKREKYLGYKVIPTMGNKNLKRKPSIEFCEGYLYKAQEDKDRYLFIRTKKITKEEYKDNKEASISANKLFTSKLIEGWSVVVPLYPQSLLRKPWKMITKVRI